MIRCLGIEVNVTSNMSSAATTTMQQTPRSLSVQPRRRPYIEPLPIAELPTSTHSRSLTPTRPRFSKRVRENKAAAATATSPTATIMPINQTILPNDAKTASSMPQRSTIKFSDNIVPAPQLKKKPTNYVLYFDTETTGLPYEKNPKRLKPFNEQPYITQISYVLFDYETYDIITIGNSYICLKDPLLVTPFITGKTGITPEMCGPTAANIVKVLCVFIRAWSQCRRIVGHNIEFDLILVTNEILRNKAEILAEDPELAPYINQFMIYRKEYLKPYKERDYTLLPKTAYCTMWGTTKFCGLKVENPRYSHLTKWPRLEELYRILFREDPPQPLHNSMIDTLVTMRCYLKYALKMDIHNAKFNRMIKKGAELAAILTEKATASVNTD